MALRQENIKRMYVTNFERKTIEDLVQQRGKGAKLYVATCGNESCKRTFVVLAYQALNQFQKYDGKFIPHSICRTCFDIAKNSTVPTLPTNAAVEQSNVAAVLDANRKSWWSFVKLRRTFEGRLVRVTFKDNSAKWGDDYLDQLYGTCVALGKLGLAMQVYGIHKTVFEAVSYPREVITNVELVTEQQIPHEDVTVPVQGEPSAEGNVATA